MASRCKTKLFYMQQAYAKLLLQPPNRLIRKYVLPTLKKK